MNAAIDELLTRQEELHPELEQYVVEFGGGMKAIKHPLVYSVPHHPGFNALMNEQFRMKSKLADEMKSDGRFAAYVFLTERPYRFEAFCEIENNLSDRNYWDLLSHVWTDSENIWQNLDGWIELLLANREHRSRYFMSKVDRKLLAAMPEVIRIYRGSPSANGLSWTVSENKAEWFATRLNCSGKVWVGEVKRRDVIGYFTDRNESEIVALPSDIEMLGKR